MSSRYPTAVEREKAKLAGIDDHPADKLSDPLSAQVADHVDGEPKKRARLKEVGGSDHEAFNLRLVNAVLDTAWFTSKEGRDKQVTTISRALAAIAPRDELEGLLGAQLLAAHSASLECYRRAMIEGQTVDSREMNLKHATKASATFATLLDTLDRHRGRVPQRVIVEHRHVHFHENGGATDGRIEAGAAGGQIENQEQPYEQRAIAHASELPLRGEDQEREAVPLSGDEGTAALPPSRRSEPRRSEG